MPDLNVSRSALAVVHAASTDTTRENLCAVRIEADGRTVATDGHILASYKPTTPADPVEPTSLNSDDVRALLKAKDGGRNLNGFAPPIHFANGAPDHFRAELPDGDRIVKRQDGEFPNWRPCMPKEAPLAVVEINLDLITSIARITRILRADKKRANFARLEIHSPFHPIVLRLQLPDGDLVSLIMPCAPGTDWRPLAEAIA